jgi:hypothetical protein
MRLRFGLFKGDESPSPTGVGQLNLMPC